MSSFIIESLFMLAVMVVCAQTTSESDGMCPAIENCVEKCLPKMKVNRSTCGGPGWTRVAFFDATNTSQACPSGLRLITSPRRMCGSSHRGGRSCSSTTFNVQGSSYQHVCGRIIGYHTGYAYAFWASLDAGRALELDYLDGVSLTHGPAGQRRHIWSFAAGVNNDPNYRNPTWNCPRATSNAPAIVGSDYFCETARGNYSNPLWDGQGCTVSPGTYCNVNNPPWFNKQLPKRITDNIEMRMCKWGSGDVSTITLIELYVS